MENDMPSKYEWQENWNSNLISDNIELKERTVITKTNVIC